jgi:hypothetical protein
VSNDNKERVFSSVISNRNKNKKNNVRRRDGILESIFMGWDGMGWDGRSYWISIEHNYNMIKMARQAKADLLL